MPHIVVIGAGIAGLAAAHALRVGGVEVTVLEGSSQIGGKLRTTPVDGIPVDEGAEAFVLRAPEGRELAEAVGLGPSLVSPVTSSALLVVRGALRSLPSRTLLGIPAEPGPIGETFGAEAACAVTGEPSLDGPPLTEDAAVGHLARRRLGDEITDGLVDPLLGGVYAGRADHLSIRATMPAVADLLTSNPSLVRAARRTLTRTATAGPVFGAVRDGMGGFAQAVLASSGAALRLGLPVRRIEPKGRGFRLVAGPVPAPTVIDADGVVVAVPAAKAARLLSDVVPWGAHELSQIEYASLAIVTLVYPTVALPAGSGLLVPATEGRSVKALTFSSQKWSHLDDGRRTVVRASIGRYGEEQVLHRDDTELVAVARQEIAELTGVDVDPLASRVTRWGGGLPQYAVGHVDRVRRIREQVAKRPGLAVCGAAYDGVGIPACIRSGRTAASAVMASLRESGT
ncbi:MAG TPA: protoporphyrinogen oxidase [Micromonosporaceae bacterium]|jgi:oxygen-dependent protoporphyrinogen oxidase|nr:protoporphyrinogen oxidase [Micromonosporaceae bacterium]